MGDFTGDEGTYQQNNMNDNNHEGFINENEENYRIDNEVNHDNQNENFNENDNQNNEIHQEVEGAVN